MERPYQGLLQFQLGNAGASSAKSYSFNGMGRSRVTSVPSGRSTGSVGTKAPRTNRARRVRGRLGRAGACGVVGAGVCVGRIAVGVRFSAAGVCALPPANRDFRSSNFGTPAESRA